MNGWGEPPIKAARGIIVFVSHLVEGFVIAGGIKLFQLHLKSLGLLEDKLLDEYPIRWLIDLLDGGILAVFVVWGIVDFFRAHGAERKTADERWCAGKRLRLPEPQDTWPCRGALSTTLWPFPLAELRSVEARELLRNCFLHPERLLPSQTRESVTAEAATKFASIAVRLRQHYDERRVAHFINKLVFCLFAQDIELLPDRIFADISTRR